MSELRVDNIVDKGGSGSPTLRKGVVVSGISTITQAVVGSNVTINAGGINATGIVTSTANKFVGDLASGNVTAGVMTATSAIIGSGVTINASGLSITGVVSATSYVGDASSMSGVGLSIAPIIYDPTVGETGKGLKPTVELTVNQRIKAGSGNISLRMVGAAGTIIENFGVGSSITIDNNGSLPKLSFTPTSNLSVGSVIYIDIPAGAITSPAGKDIKATGWTFTTKPNYALWAWGNNDYGQLAQNDRTSRSSAVQIPGEWLGIVNQGANRGSDNYWGMGNKSDGTLWMWGYGWDGCLGQNQGPGNSFSSPVQIPGSTWSTSLFASNYRIAATKTDGTLWMWGQNQKGYLGLNDVDSRSSPTQIPGTWGVEAKVATGNETTFAVKTDGTLWSWGYGEYGMLGNNQNGPGAKQSSPVQIPGTDWSDVIGGSLFGTALKTDGTLWSWGLGNGGRLGLNDTEKYSSPTQIGSDTTWSTISSQREAVVATKTDGTLWTWGANEYGQLGQNQGGPAQYSSPIQVGSATDWTKVGGGAGHFLAYNTDGELWAWGYNQNGGSFGNNSVINTSSPVQVPGTWADYGCAANGTFAFKSL